MRINIKPILLSFLLLPVAISNAQDKSWLAIKQYAASLNLPDGYPYINFSTSLNQKLIGNYFYYKKGDGFVLALVEGGIDSLKERSYTTDVLFEKVDAHLKQLIKLSNKSLKRDDYFNAMNDPLIVFANLGIRYKRLHYNHYTPATPALLATIKNEELVAVYEAFDFIIQFFKEQIPGRNN